MTRPVTERTLTRAAVAYLLLAPLSVVFFIGTIGDYRDGLQRLLANAFALMPTLLVVCPIMAIAGHRLGWAVAVRALLLAPLVLAAGMLVLLALVAFR